MENPGQPFVRGLEAFSGRTVTFLFTDIQGSTQLQARLGETYLAVRGEHHRLLRYAFKDAGGIEVDTQGDSFFYVFPRARDAIVAALAAQKALADHPWPDARGPSVRMGLHSGEPQISDDGFVGLSVVRAARIMATAHGGQVLLSQTTYSLVRDDLPAEAVVRDVGKHRLKDFDDSQRLFQVSVAGLPSRFPRIRSRRRITRRRLVAVTLVAAALASLLAFVVGRGGRTSVSLPENAAAMLDPRSGSVVKAFRLGAAPAQLIFANGAAWVAVPAAAGIARIDARSTTPQTVPLGPLGLAHPTVLAAAGKFLWVGLGPDRLLQRIDTQYVGTLAGKSVPTSAPPVALTIGAGALWVATGSNVEQRDALTGKPQRPPLVPQLGSTALAFVHGLLWVGGSFGVTAIDPETGRTQATVAIPGRVTTMAASSGNIWVGFATTGAPGFGGRTGVARLDPVSASVSATLDLDARPTAISAVGGEVWVATVDDALLGLDPARATVQKRLQLSISPTALAVGSGRLWIAGE